MVSVLQVITDGGELELGNELDDRQLAISEIVSCAWVRGVEYVETDVISVVYVSVMEWNDVNDSSDSSEL